MIGPPPFCEPPKITGTQALALTAIGLAVMYVMSWLMLR